MSMIVFDFEQWTVKDYTEFQATLKSGDIETQVRLMVKAIKRWEFDVDVTFDNLLDMPYGIITELSQIMADTFKSMMDEPISGFSVDLSKAKVSDFLKYQKALQSFDLVAIKDTMARVLRAVPQGFHDGKAFESFTVEDVEKINLEQFFSYLRAVSLEFGKNQSGK